MDNVWSNYNSFILVWCEIKSWWQKHQHIWLSPPLFFVLLLSFSFFGFKLFWKDLYFILYFTSFYFLTTQINTDDDDDETRQDNMMCIYLFFDDDKKHKIEIIRRRCTPTKSECETGGKSSFTVMHKQHLQIRSISSGWCCIDFQNGCCPEWYNSQLPTNRKPS